MFPITQKAMEGYRKVRRVAITIEGNGSAGGITALLEGTADICASSRKIDTGEIARAKSAGVDVQEVLIARDMIVPVVHPSNRMKNITMAQLRGIHDGTINNWKQLGGPDEKIASVARDGNSGTRDTWLVAMLNRPAGRDNTPVHASNGAVVASVAGNPRAIGYVSSGYVNDSVRPLSVETVTPSPETGKTRAYPITRELYLYFNGVKVSGEARDFINFMTGPAGQKLIGAAGFIPPYPRAPQGR
jgi:phosphate transport system substrate-binding protein